ncbi:hypothetical protein J8273_7201 [Carpediemonas membranifera]|uniref:Uncharacterized protein n=1 Tax=Carpediemonas membranifera TaxID=201153 RepID=A0A8J6B1C5_9EUKA|nr:hypothetical protein J8273_7201 [Carpediemonas membranifera]|eukprot:KAG9390932.1 hypothetical protein J8273_7201 [Carpediemonas membranifera]
MKVQEELVRAQDRSAAATKPSSVVAAPQPLPVVDAESTTHDEFSDTDESESDDHSEPAAMQGDGVPLPQTDQDIDVESDVDDTDTVGSLLQQLDDTIAGLDDVPESVRLLEQYEPLIKRLAEEREAREALEQANRESEESQKRLEAELGQQKAEDQAIHQFTQAELARASEAGLEALADELEDNWAELVRRAEEATVELDRYVPLAALMVLFQRNNVTGALWTRINSTMMRYGGQKFITVPPLDLGLSPEMKAIIKQHSPTPANVPPMQIYLRSDVDRQKYIDVEYDKVGERVLKDRKSWRKIAVNPDGLCIGYRLQKVENGEFDKKFAAEEVAAVREEVRAWGILRCWREAEA